VPTPPITPGPTDALLIIDLQNDICPGGHLPVEHGDQIVPLINRLGRRFAHVLLTQDWHPAGHISFASSHAGRRPHDTITAPYGSQTLWPDHCLQASYGAAFHPGLDLPHAELILRKGFRPTIDSYSAFLENDHQTPTGLAGYLRERGLQRLFLAGLAYDFCVRFSALDGAALGFECLVLEGACRPVAVKNSVEFTNQSFADRNIPRLQTSTLL